MLLLVGCGSDLKIKVHYADPVVTACRYDDEGTSIEHIEVKRSEIPEDFVECIVIGENNG
jgi:hypothetical protein